MKTVFAILLSIAMLVVQAGTLSPSSARETSVCCHCDCGRVNCCVEEGGQPSEPAPAAPSTVPHSSFDLIPALARSLTRAPALSAAFLPPPAFALPGARVPLYQRNCALLL